MFRDQDRTIDLSWGVSKERDSFVEIYGSEGTILVGWQKSSYQVSSSDDWVQFGDGYNRMEAMSAQVDNFLRSLGGIESLLVEAENGIASVAVVEAAYASLNSPQGIPVQGGSDSDRVVA